MNSLAKGGGKKRRVQYCLNPYASNNFVYFRAIQGHSGGNFVSLSLQGNVLLPDHFAENIYHIGNAFKMHSIIKSGLIPGGKSLRRDKQSVFFHSSEPDGRKSNTIWTAVCWSHLWLRRRVSRRQFWRRTLLWFSAELKRTGTVASTRSLFCCTCRGI